MEFEIGNRVVGGAEPTFIIAELSANHLRDYDLAVKTIKAMKNSGADALKLQTYTGDTLTLDSENECFKINHGTLWDGMKLYDLYNEGYMPWEWQPELKNIAEDLGLLVFSSVGDKTSVDFMESLDIPAYKIPSFEITDIPLIEYVASKGKPVILSTGISRLCDVEEAVRACRKMGNNQIAILKCTSAYPTPLDSVNLRTIPNLAETFNIVSGLSDHTMELAVPVAAVALGAKIVEKHFILDRNLGGSDAAFSMEPAEFETMVKSVRRTEKALGNVEYDLTEATVKMRDFTRSLFVVKDIKMGEAFTTENIKSIRPGLGMHPKFLNDLLHRKARNDIKRGTPMSWDLVD
ncbi:MAG TPA: pseudaminic acid synthase [Methanobacteriaceae archaeon]|nr:pseudaminic acid synthase [Methanobacteriaceae archaeon]